jgi:hypothetical protein
MRHPIADLANMICETLTFCNEPGHKRELQKTAKEMGQTFEQIVAAALAQRIAENFEVRHGSTPQPQPDGSARVE